MDQQTPPERPTLPARRRAEFLRYIASSGEATVTQLAETFGVSLDTVRRDLDRLADEGAVVRTHGGAVPAGELATADTPFDNRIQAGRGAKEAIGRAAAELINDRETLLINGGTTALAVLRALGGRRDLTIVTNNLRAPAEIPDGVARDIYLLGGNIRRSSWVTIGPVGFADSHGISADVAVIGVGGVSATSGFSTTNLPEAQMMLAMINSSSRAIILADSSKFGRNAFAHICDLGTADILVTEAEPEPELAAALSEADVRLITPG